MPATIIFDFDGTLAVGNGPVLAYARQVAEVAGEGFLQRVEAGIADFEAGNSPCRDGYDVVGSLAAAEGVTEAQLGRAYQRSRELLGTEAAPVTTMPGLDDFLTGLRRHARLVLATNAPEVGVDAVLDAWGVREAFDALHFAVGKPAGLAAVVRDTLAEGPVLAVGDIAEYDLAPARSQGADTALVGATAADDSITVTMRGRSLADLRTAIESWAAAAAQSSEPPRSDAAGTTRKVVPHHA